MLRWTSWRLVHSRSGDGDRSDPTPARSDSIERSDDVRMSLASSQTAQIVALRVLQPRGRILGTLNSDSSLQSHS